MAENVLHVEHVTMQFGGVVAVNDLSLDVNPACCCWMSRQPA